ncbi:MAG: response regulator [Phycisphaerales bacterium]|jgi:CheY-like chemotaxis protein/DNA-binding XRE family transcriptional regulator|nr:response regulator [Phycisphaerales bacterium]
MNQDEISHPPVPPLRIATLDDDEDFRQYLSGVLAQDGHEVQACESGAALIAAIQEQMPDLVLLDMKMGRERGEQVLADLRQRWPRLCVIVVTGYPSMDSMRQTFKQDVFDYLAKPFSISELRASLGQAVATLGIGRRPEDRLRAELGRQIRLARAERGWTLKDLSESSGVSVSQLSSIERGAHLPSLESMVAVATALGRRPSSWLEAAGL